MKRETLFLKLVVVLMGLPILALCIFVLPSFSGYVLEIMPKQSYVQVLFLVGMYASAVVYFYALFQTMKLLSYIDKQIAFSEMSVKALKSIKLCAIMIGLLYVAELPILFLIADADDAPGIIVIGLMIVFGCMVIAVFAAVLQKLLKNAIAIKNDNDLTI